MFVLDAAALHHWYQSCEGAVLPLGALRPRPLPEVRLRPSEVTSFCSSCSSEPFRDSEEQDLWDTLLDLEHVLGGPGVRVPLLQLDALTVSESLHNVLWALETINSLSVARQGLTSFAQGFEPLLRLRATELRSSLRSGSSRTEILHQVAIDHLRSEVVGDSSWLDALTQHAGLDLAPHGYVRNLCRSLSRTWVDSLDLSVEDRELALVSHARALVSDSARSVVPGVDLVLAHEAAAAFLGASAEDVLADCLGEDDLEVVAFSTHYAPSPNGALLPAAMFEAFFSAEAVCEGRLRRVLLMPGRAADVLLSDSFISGARARTSTGGARPSTAELEVLASLWDPLDRSSSFRDLADALDASRRLGAPA